MAVPTVYLVSFCHTCAPRSVVGRISTPSYIRKVTLPPTAEKSWRDFRHEIKTALGFRRKTNDWGFLGLKQPFGIFNEYGKRLSSAKEAEDAALIFVVEGGQWYWPPLRKGFVRKLHGTNLSLETLSVQPVIFRVQGFLREHECEEIVNLGKGRMFSSPVSLMDKDKGKAAKEFRTSTQARNTKQALSLIGKQHIAGQRGQ